MAEEQSFELMPYFTWTIKDIPSTLMLESSIFTVADVKFKMLFQQYDGISTIFMVPVVEDQQSTAPSYAIETCVSIKVINKSLEDFLFIQKTNNSNNSGPKERHIIWELETRFFDNIDLVLGEIGEKNATFFCIFGPLGESQKDEAEFKNPWSKFCCMERLGDDLDKMRLNEDPSFVLKCGDKTLPVHDIILSARSKIFAEMILNNLTEKEVEIKDMKYEVLENFITYIYSGRLKDCKPTVGLLINLYKMAHEYKVEHLKMMASSRLIQVLKNFNILNNAELSGNLQILDQGKLAGKPGITNEKMLTILSLELLSMADEYKDENFKKSIILSIVDSNTFILTDDRWKDFRNDNTMLSMEVYDILVNKV